MTDQPGGVHSQIFNLTHRVNLRVAKLNQPDLLQTTASPVTKLDKPTYKLVLYLILPSYGEPRP